MKSGVSVSSSKFEFRRCDRRIIYNKDATTASFYLSAIFSERWKKVIATRSDTLVLG